MVLYLVGVVAFLALSTVIWLLDPNPTQVLSSYISLGILIITVNIFITERMKRSLGKRLVELRSINKVIITFLNCGLIAILIVSIKLLGQDKGTWAAFTWVGTLFLWLIYISLFTGRFAMEEGFFYYGDIVRWRDIQCYEWGKGFFPFNRNALVLNICKKGSRLKPRIRIYVHKGQQDFVNSILQNKGLKEMR